MMLSLLPVLLCLQQTLAASAADWRSRSVYQVLTDRFARPDGSTTAPCNPDGTSGDQTYCGGTYEGMISKLDYIQGMGFDAIWISPVTRQISDASRAYHGYSQVDLYRLNPHFGDLKALSTALHARGMYLMVDIVVNHFGANGPATSMQYDTMTPFNQQSFFHPPCWIDDYNNMTQVVLCWLGNNEYPLPDVATTQSHVRSVYQDWIKGLISNYSIDGLRIDTVKDVELDFFDDFQKAAGVYAVGEYSDGNVDPACAAQNHLDAILNYPGYYQSVQFFSKPTATSQNLVGEQQYLNTTCKDPTLLGTFSENHDQPRFASMSDDMAAAQNVLVWTLFSDGIPIVFQGQEQHWSSFGTPQPRDALWFSDYDTNAQLYKFIKNLNTVRKSVMAANPKWQSARMRYIYSDDHHVAIAKGSPGSVQTVAILSNVGSSGGNQTLNLGKSTGWPPGAVVKDLVSGSSHTVSKDGSMSMTITGGTPIILSRL